MPDPSENKPVQGRNLADAEAIAWTLVPRAEAKRRRGC